MGISLKRVKTFAKSIKIKVKDHCHICLEGFRKMKKLQRRDWFGDEKNSLLQITIMK